MIKTKLFTLIELLITIVVIGVLAAIIVPNISTLKQDSTTAAMQANIKNIETALTMYALENHGALPILGEPEIGLPEPLLLDQLHPDFLRNLPEVNSMKYWVDYTEKVWASSADSPTGIVYMSDGTLKWEEAANAESFNIFKTETNNVTSKASNKKIVFVESSKATGISLPELNEGEFYLVNSVDSFGLESPPVSNNYQGNIVGSEIPETGVSQKEKFPWPMDMGEVKWNSTEPALTDGDETTYRTVRQSEEYILDWQGDLANRVFQITFSTEYDSDTSKQFNFLNAEGQPIPFINAHTDQRYTTYAAGHNLSKRTIEFVVPRDATQLKIHGTAIINLFKADFVDDLSLPYPVENVNSTVTADAMTINWSPPSNAENFLKVAVYDGDDFLGYSTDGSFIVSPLYANKEYLFSLEPISKVGNRGQRVAHTNKTLRPEIVWSGLNNAGAFDSSVTTYSIAEHNGVIRWGGDLTDRQLDILHTTYTGNSGGFDQSFQFFNEENQVVSSKVKGNNALMSVFTLTRTGTYSVLVPEGATHIKFTAGNVQAKIYDISYGTTLALPSNLTNVETTSTTESVTLTFNRPLDVERVAIFRDGVFLDYSSTDSYTDTALYSNKEYIYTFETYTSFGHRNKSGGSVNAKTLSAEINWSGLNGGGAFDSSMTTYSTALINAVIRWDVDLTGSQLDINYYTYVGSTGGRYQSFQFQNDNGQVIPSNIASSTTITSTFNLTREGIYSVIVPAGATHIKFTDGNRSSLIYDVTVAN